MAIRKIVLAGAPVLKTKAQPVTKMTKSIKTLLKDMKDTLYDANGVGLAAPQVGESLRIFVIDDGNGYVEYINPEIITLSDEKEEMTEGCLSVPGFVGVVERSTGVTVRYEDRNGRTHEVSATGLLAQAIQHENDHIDGTLYIERAKNLYKENEGTIE
ncbi:MAG: peptide deformylase [Negativicoccus succinicivorans]|nr:peptide deformylase [Negativicoccus succinicivorans]MDU2417407.1 peptide deformylase [Negativicoccus succinicivorans]